MSGSCLSSSARRLGGRRVSYLGILGLLFCFFLPLLLAGCGGGKDSNPVLAKVGEREILTSYYEDRLGKLAANELPWGKDGLPVDTSTLEGKKTFLKVIIDKEVMAQKAILLGYDREEKITGAVQTMRDFQAGKAMYDDVCDVPARSISPEEAEYYYSHLSEVRDISFIICNFFEDAMKARAEVLEGKLWQDVAEMYHDGSLGPKGDFRVDVQWGYYEDTFEQAVFSLDEGGVSQPIETVYGYWLVRVEEIKTIDVEPFESYQERILNSIRTRKVNLARQELLKEIRQKYEFQLNEDALWVCYQGLPEGEEILDPATNQPVPRENLKPLEIPTHEMDKVLYTFRLRGELETMTVGDYKAYFETMNVFQRPKKHEMLGGFRRKITEMVDRPMIVEEAKARGYFEDTRIVDHLRNKKEEMMITKMHSDVVMIDEKVGPDELNAFWKEHKPDYIVSEGREGKVVYCEDEATAKAAASAARSGTGWSDILSEFGSDTDNFERSGKVDMIRSHHTGELRDAFFELGKVGDVSDPFPFGAKWAVVLMENLQTPFQKEFEEVKADITKRILMRRQDQALRNLIDEWTEEFGVTIFDENLAKVRSWDEIAEDTSAQRLSS